MPWFKVDDSFYSSPKVQSIPRGAPRLRALGLWTSVGAWCAQHLTDGRFSRETVKEHGGTPADLGHLLDADLWISLDSGYAFKNWEEYQPTRAQVEAEREKKAEAGRKGGIASGRSRSKREAPASRIVEPPTRPDPSPSAAAAAEGTPPPLPPAVEILRGALAAAKLEARWDRLTADQLAEVERLVDLHGDAALVKAALAVHRPDKPAAFAQAWLGTWSNLTAPGELRLVRPDPCPTHGLPGTIRRCVGCAADALVEGTNS